MHCTFCMVHLTIINKYIKMVSPNKTKDPYAVENLFCKPMDKIKKVKLTSDQRSLVVSLLMAKVTKDSTVDRISKAAESSGIWYYPVFRGRIEAMGYQVDRETEAMVNIGLTKSVGDAVMYANYLAYKAKKCGVSKIGLVKELCEWFQDGFPKHSELDKVWSFQKVHTDIPGTSDNLLDYPEASKSIYCKKEKQS